MKTIKIKAPAKINLTLKVLGKRADGFHEIESVMQSINLYDFITVSRSKIREIILDGTKRDILNYDKKNIAYRAAEIFFENTKIQSGAKIFIEKNIPVSAGLAGGSADGAGVLYGLNKLFDSPLNEAELLKLCEKLGSDLNFCLLGGRALVKGRGEIFQKLPFEKLNLTIVKPKKIGISAKEAYDKFDRLELHNSNLTSLNQTEFQNDLEYALVKDYKVLEKLHNLGLKMSGSGSAFFKIGDFNLELDETEFEIIKGLRAIPFGVLEVF